MASPRAPGNDDQQKPPGNAPVWFCLDADKAADELDVDPAVGLTNAEAARRLRRFGYNQLKEGKAAPWWRILADQFKNIVVALLVTAALISFAVGEGDVLEGLAIIAVIVLNTGIGFITELRANRAMEALQRLGRCEAVVIRDGRKESVPAPEIVRGDIVALEEGQAAPADGRVLESAELQVDESALTGESVPVYKNADAIEDPKTGLADRTNMVYRGTSTTSGNGVVVVVATGMATQIGHISRMVMGVADEETPLEKRLARLGRKLMAVCLLVAGLVILSGIVQGERFADMVKAGIALAIAAIPEGLPAVATITLAIGMKRMARRNALIRRLPAVETLGSVTCVCSDKTGTLTRSEMALHTLSLPDDSAAPRRIETTGLGYEPIGEFIEAGRPADHDDPQLRAALSVGALCNNASLRRDEQGRWQITGDPTEAALLVAAQKAGLARDALNHAHARTREYPFSSETMIMGTLNEGAGVKVGGGPGPLLCVKGSPMRVLERCTQALIPGGSAALTEQQRKALERENDALAAQGLRVLGLAFRAMDSAPEDRDQALKDLTWVALAGIIDPPREEAMATVDILTRAGIHTVMITGDQPPTAAAIAARMHVAPPGAPVLTGRELEELSKDELDAKLRDVEVFARVSPEQKVKIVDALHRRGEICAMLGDGVNDAVALKAADIGVAMGIRGTDVARETADMVLLDDRFKTVADAVSQGRIVYANIRKFIQYLFSCNLSEILTMLGASLLGEPLLLLPLQILWLNLVTDVLPALSLAVEPGEEDIMEQPARPPKAPLLGRAATMSIIASGLLMTICTVAAYLIGRHVRGHVEVEGIDLAKTMAFLTLGFSQIFYSFNGRKETGPLRFSQWWSNPYAIGAAAVTVALQLGAVYVPGLSHVLRTAGPAARLRGADWTVIAACSLAPLAIAQGWRWARTFSQRGMPSCR